MNNEDVRRLFIQDLEWERTSSSWKDLLPRKNFNHIDDSDETEIEYYERHKKKYGIPLEVIEQWIHPLYYCKETVNNYGWLDYCRIKFIKSKLRFEELSGVYVIDNYKKFVEERGRVIAFEEFVCIEKDLEFWKQECTWRVPPIILDVRTLDKTEIPYHAEIEGPYQLVEGHSRMGYLFAAKKSGVLTKDEHSVYMMKYM